MNANVGMQYPVYAPVNVYTPGTSITYNTGAVAGEAVSAALSWERADGHFYGDDVELDSDNGILGYTLDIELSGLKATAAHKKLDGSNDGNDVCQNCESNRNFCIDPLHHVDEYYNSQYNSGN